MIRLVPIKKERPKLEEKKKPKNNIDYASETFLQIKNFIVPNQKSYSILPRKHNDKRLNNFIHTNFYMNTFTNVATFYQTSIYYRSNILAHIGEFFCHDFGFDGIFVEVLEISKPSNRLTKIKDDRTILYFYDDYLYLDNSIIEPEKSSCIYAMNALKLLSQLKQFERDALFINGMDTMPYTNYLCYLHIMKTTLEKYYETHKKASSPKILFNSLPEQSNLLIFDELYLMLNCLDNYLENNSKELKMYHRKNLVATILMHYYSFALGTDKKPIKLTTLLKNDKKIINEYKKLFGHTKTGKEVIDALESYTPSMLEEVFNEKQLEINEFCTKYSKWYFDYFKTILPAKRLDFIAKAIMINGYAFITYLIDAVYMFEAGSILCFDHYLNLYNKHYKHNSLDITGSLTQPHY